MGGRSRQEALEECELATGPGHRDVPHCGGRSRGRPCRERELAAGPDLSSNICLKHHFASSRKESRVRGPSNCTSMSPVDEVPGVGSPADTPVHS